MPDEQGFTLGEVLVATLVLSIGIVSVVTGLQHATSAVENGRGETMAVLLGEARLEGLKALALADWANETLNAATTTEGYGSIARATSYRRVTVITDGPGGPCTAGCKLVHVAVFYRPVTARGQLNQERRVDVATLLVSRR